MKTKRILNGIELNLKKILPLLIGKIEGIEISVKHHFIVNEYREKKEKQEFVWF